MAPSLLDDEHAPLFTVGQVADARGQAGLPAPRGRTAGGLAAAVASGQRRYTRYEIRVIQQVVSMADEGITLQAIRRIIDLERQLAVVAAERDELARGLAELLQDH